MCKQCRSSWPVSKETLCSPFAAIACGNWLLASACQAHCASLHAGVECLREHSREVLSVSVLTVWAVKHAGQDFFALAAAAMESLRFCTKGGFWEKTPKVLSYLCRGMPPRMEQEGLSGRVPKAAAVHLQMYKDPKDQPMEARTTFRLMCGSQGADRHWLSGPPKRISCVPAVS